MISICKLCKHKNNTSKCSTCIGNPYFTDNYSPAELIPLKQLVEESGYKFGTSLTKQGKRAKREIRKW